ncbi:EF-hand domain-containing protein [Streptomyces sp. NBC_00320]|uniref:EF-hand domain-containing protein n=1 Tax=unclassified Streptomyces TaxID=2593676 RepID=UPI002259388F|nr:EF-hand domain-containing protein [Streptomyces sp. NBC_00320]MCX5150872.1 EF-hand domain-containing protein [Streptomyces sp. NBC_00320]
MATTVTDPIDLKIGYEFDALDTDGDGIVTWEDYQDIVDRHAVVFGLSPHDRRIRAVRATYGLLWQEFLRHTAVAADQGLTKEQYIRACRATSLDTSRIKMTEAAPHAVFDALDLDGDNKVSESDFSRYLSEVRRIAMPGTMDAFAALDTDGDGFISRNEFIRSVREFLRSDDLDRPGSLYFGRLQQS